MLSRSSKKDNNMNIYDFDKTIYDGDSTAAFIKYCAKRYPRAYITILPTAWAFFLYMIGFYTKTQFKERMYRFFKYIPDTDMAVAGLWDTHEGNILDYYKRQRRDTDIVISASPEFLLKPIAERLGIARLIASRVDKNTGKYTGENCWGGEKVIRLKNETGITHCDEFYSDSKSDQPLADISDRAYIVRRNTLIPWDEYKETATEKFRHMFLTPQFLMFIIIGGINTLANILFSAVYSLFIPSTTTAFVAGYVTANVLAYIMNSKITFKEDRLSIIKYFKFFISYIPNFLIQTAIVWLTSRLTLLPPVAAYAIAAVIGVPVTFVIMKLFTFRRSKAVK